MKNYIRKVKVRSLFENNYDLDINFEEKTNCIFGENGTGKTTIINLIVATLNCDIKVLSSIPFESIEILTAKFGTKRARKSIFVNKLNEEEIEFSIFTSEGKKNFKLQKDSRKSQLEREEILNILGDILHLTYVPLSRLAYNESLMEHPEEYILNRALRARHIDNDEVLGILDPSRRMLKSIEKEFIEKYSIIQNRINTDSEEMKNNIVRRTLIDEEFLKKSDEFASKIQTNRKSSLSKQYNATEVMSKFKSANIEISSEHLETHFRLWDKVTTEFEEASNYMKNNSVR